MTTADSTTRRRVKLYALNADRQWDDRGTGHVTSNFVERLKGLYNIFLCRKKNETNVIFFQEFHFL